MVQTIMTEMKTVSYGIEYDPEALAGDVDGLYGRMPPQLQKLVRKIVDAPNYDFAAMELLDGFQMEWRKG
jgi:hypothetical protein